VPNIVADGTSHALNLTLLTTNAKYQDSPVQLSRAGGYCSVAIVGSSWACLVACKESNQALGSRKPVDWIPGPSLHCVPHATQSTSGESSVSPEPPSSRAISRMRRTRGSRQRRWHELRLCGEKAVGEFRSPPALPAPYLA
jgi:hypothetical protein